MANSSSIEKEKATAQFNKLAERLASVGLSTEVRAGDASSVLVFVRVLSEEYMYGEVYRSRYGPIFQKSLQQTLMYHRVNDWIHGIRAAAPEKETRRSLEAEPLHEGERLRIIHRLITNPETEGGAGITAKEGEWENVESIFALHNHAYNKAWIKKWSTKYLLDSKDLDEIRDRLGENVSFPPFRY